MLSPLALQADDVVYSAQTVLSAPLSCITPSPAVLSSSLQCSVHLLQCKQVGQKSRVRKTH